MKLFGMGALAVAAAVAAALPAAAPAAPVPEPPSSAGKAREATARYHDVARAEKAGYGVFTDAAGIACIDKPGEGGMGIHYVNGALVGNDTVDVRTPEALVYEPEPNGRLRLVALEYIVFQDVWDAAHADPPSLFGREFELVKAGNRYGLPPFYELHAWLWKNNPAGLFEDWNPRVVC